MPRRLLPPAAGGSGQQDVANVYHVSFDQTKSCLAVGTDRGVLIFQADPSFAVLPNCVFPRSVNIGFRIVEMFYRSNLVALVGNGSFPPYAANTVVLWDTDMGRSVREITCKSAVLAVKISRERLIMVLLEEVIVCEAKEGAILEVIPTWKNPGGACSISEAIGHLYMVCPSQEQGFVRVHNGLTGSVDEFRAHESAIQCIGMTQDGQFYATASIKGTVVRVFSINGVIYRLLRRGFSKADIGCLSFSSDFKWLALSSDNGTIHLYKLGDLSFPKPLLKGLEEINTHSFISSFTGALNAEK